MGIVQLNGNLVGQEPEIGVFFLEAVEDIMDGCRSKKIFLLETQLLTLDNVVGRIEHLGDGFRLHLLFHGADVVSLVEELQVEVTARLGAPQAHGVDRVVLVTGDGRIVGHGHDIFRIDHSLTVLPNLLVVVRTLP